MEAGGEGEQGGEERRGGRHALCGQMQYQYVQALTILSFTLQHSCLHDLWRSAG